jgi:hypothetical protein
MSYSDLIAFPLLLAAILAGTALCLTRSGGRPATLAVAYELCVRVALSGIMLIVALLVRGDETGLLAVVPVLLLSLDLGWDLSAPSADPEGG